MEGWWDGGRFPGSQNRVGNIERLARVGSETIRILAERDAGRDATGESARA